MCVAGAEGGAPSERRTLRVATKFPHIAAWLIRRPQPDIDIVKLNGSIELAPVLG
jgi:ATP phosphoribosyltransferase